jgi:cytidylate kinase
VAHRVVCISGATGAGASEVAEIVAARLGYRLIDEEIVARAAHEAGLEHEVVADVEQRKSFVARLVSNLGSGADSLAAGSGFPLSSGDGRLTSDDLRALIRSAIEETARRGDVVIVYHAAAHALARRYDILRVLVTGSPGVRATRVAETHGVPENEAVAVIAAEDAGRADYLRRFYGVGSEQPTQYDLVVNTDRLEAENAAELVLLAASSA